MKSKVRIQTFKNTRLDFSALTFPNILFLIYYPIYKNILCFFVICKFSSAMYFLKYVERSLKLQGQVKESQNIT